MLQSPRTLRNAHHRPYVDVHPFLLSVHPHAQAAGAPFGRAGPDVQAGPTATILDVDVVVGLGLTYRHSGNMLRHTRISWLCRTTSWHGGWFSHCSGMQRFTKDAIPWPTPPDSIQRRSSIRRDSAQSRGSWAALVALTVSALARSGQFRQVMRRGVRDW